MCGIVGYIGKRDAYPILIKGLHRLEYRGYDSAGVALINPQQVLNVYKSQGKVSALEDTARSQDLTGSIGIAHTRWATHGIPNHTNAHPQVSQNGRIAIVHNGIIENYAELKANLLKQGVHFNSDTDTEVIAQQIAYIQEVEHLTMVEAVRRTLQQAVGSYAICVLDNAMPDTIVAARKGSPLVVGVGDDEYFLGSDASPIIEYTQRIIYLEDGEMVVLHKGQKPQISDLEGHERPYSIQHITMTVDDLEKGGYPHFMLKEICEQPQSLAACMRSRLVENEICLPEVDKDIDMWLNARRIIITACGTSLYAGMAGKYAIEELAHIPVETDYASEFRYRHPVIQKGDIVIAISQSGETADTLAAIDQAKQNGAKVVSICNVIGSSIPRASDSVIYTMVGPEIGVASTKAFTAQVTVLMMIAILLGYRKGVITESRYRSLVNELQALPQKASEIIKRENTIRDMAQAISFAPNVLYIGRGYNYPTALEGALKLKEISYIHAEGYPAAEMKHGPIALISQDMPVVAIATDSPIYDKLVSNIQEIRARQGHVMAIVTEGDKKVSQMADKTVCIPATAECLSPLLAIIPLQLLSYHVACLKGCNVDQPRNLAKSVTVE